MAEALSTFTIRVATLDDLTVLQGLVADSVWVLQAKEYNDAQREAAIKLVYGIDTQLIRDGTYFVVEQDQQIVACGGWSRRRTLFGGDQHSPSRAPELLDSANEPARIRAFFVKPGWERRGIGSALVRACERAALSEGFHQIEMASTLTGVALYSAHGYREVERIDVPLEDELTLPVIRMAKAFAKS
ncbi:MAG TPA: GNAT family N-acetyltransferase [Candidatus Limnocylindrales bacterium]|jgi:GNAT superfamily N-acetyltransferase|nr:GNAT family N-acetyltransferase [Candidatus Limnocylindrales bacterium]